MFPNPERQKGGGPQLGASTDGERGPFGVRGDNGDQDDQQHDD